jgi:predicted 3-demethylubiquinone-9 3-methyltransferase (glyoxalase superfamily)
MPALTRKITPFLWFDTQAEQAAKFYTTIFRNSRINQISRYGKAGHETHGMDAGSVMTVAFEIEGQSFVALNGGPHFKFNEAVSFQITCEARRRTRSIISGASCRKTARKASAAGSRTNSASRGKSCRPFCRIC